MKSAMAQCKLHHPSLRFLRLETTSACCAFDGILQASLLLKPPVTVMVDPHKHLTALKVAIALRHGCDSAHRETVQLRAVHTDAGWDGAVEVFDLHGHSEACICYAWYHLEATGIKIITVLGNKLIDSAHKAVHAMLSPHLQMHKYPGGRW